MEVLVFSKYVFFTVPFTQTKVTAVPTLFLLRHHQHDTHEAYGPIVFFIKWRQDSLGTIIRLEKTVHGWKYL